MLDFERSLWEKGLVVAGVDEAGRGPLAGPVVACAVILPPFTEPFLKGDSKKLSQKEREEAYEHIKKIAIAIGTAVVSLYKANYSDLDLVLKEEDVEAVDGFLFDLGMSMLQLKSPRGFSFQRDEPLDMRMDPEQKLTAFDVVNKYSEKDLERILREYGEERRAKAIAKAIVLQRSKKPIETTGELVNVVLSVVKRTGRIHPATKVFQAIRIEVNKELEHLKIALWKVPRYLRKGGRLVVISFHSLEDRLVKNFFKEHASQFKILTKKPITPGREEVMRNPASRSAKLRAGEKL
jgi:16S rRNA (cytosine1402-N4)-methyltransferase